MDLGSSFKDFEKILSKLTVEHLQGVMCTCSDSWCNSVDRGAQMVRLTEFVSFNSFVEILIRVLTVSTPINISTTLLKETNSVRRKAVMISGGRVRDNNCPSK